jgi:hypothetical protein
LCAGCASSRVDVFDTVVDYRDDELERVRSYGKRLMVLPVLTASGAPDTASPFSFYSLAGLFDEERGGYRLVDSRRFARRMLLRPEVDALRGIYRQLYAGNADSLAERSAVWDAIDADYMLVVKQRGGARIATFNRDERLRLGLEAELWDCERREIVWRAHSAGTAEATRVDEKRFVRAGVQAIVAALPVFQQRRMMSGW